MATVNPNELWFRVDEEDLEKIKHYKWFRAGRYAIAHIYRNGIRTSLYMQRLIISCPSGMEIDHINSDGLDNRKINLRIATRKQNSFNQKVDRENNTSGYKGVSWKIPHGRVGYWYAGIEVNNKAIHLGCFKDKTEAAMAYNEAAKKYFGEYARLNLI